jgi:hypothetical protein
MMNIILLSFSCIITLPSLAGLLLNGKVGTWKPEKRAGGLYYFPGGTNPHVVFNYGHNSSNNSSFTVNTGHVHGKAVKG